MFGTLSLSSMSLDGGGSPGVAAPTAPVLSVVEPVTNPPAFDVDLPSGNGDYRDAAVADVLRVQITLSTDAGFASVAEEVTVTLDADDLIADTITVPGLDALATGTYIARARLERGAAVSAWSDTTDSFELTAATPYEFVVINGRVGSGSTTYSFSADIGDAAEDRVVIIVTGNSNTSSTVTAASAAGTSLSSVVTHSGDLNEAILAAVVPAGSGSQTISVTWSAGGFAEQFVAVYVAYGVSATAAATKSGSGTFSVEAGDLLISGRTSVAPPGNMNTYTEVPDQHSVTASTYGMTVGDAIIAATNASFSTGTGGDRVSAVFR